MLGPGSLFGAWEPTSKAAVRGSLCDLCAQCLSFALKMPQLQIYYLGQGGGHWHRSLRPGRGAFIFCSCPEAVEFETDHCTIVLGQWFSWKNCSRRLPLGHHPSRTLVTSRESPWQIPSFDQKTWTSFISIMVWDSQIGKLQIMGFFEYTGHIHPLIC